MGKYSMPPPRPPVFFTDLSCPFPSDHMGLFSHRPQEASVQHLPFRTGSSSQICTCQALLNLQATFSKNPTLNCPAKYVSPIIIHHTLLVYLSEHFSIHNYNISLNYYLFNHLSCKTESPRRRTWWQFYSPLYPQALGWLKYKCSDLPLKVEK